MPPVFVHFDEEVFRFPAHYHYHFFVFSLFDAVFLQREEGGGPSFFLRKLFCWMIQLSRYVSLSVVCFATIKMKGARQNDSLPLAYHPPASKDSYVHQLG